MENKDYAVVLTSCGRFDLLRQTCLSFARYADILPRQFIVVEDSGCEEVREVLADISLPVCDKQSAPRTSGGDRCRLCACENRLCFSLSGRLGFFPQWIYRGIRFWMRRKSAR